MSRHVGTTRVTHEGLTLVVELYVDPEHQPLFMLHLSYQGRKHFWSRKKVLYEFDTPVSTKEAIQDYMQVFCRQLPKAFDHASIQAMELML